MLQSSECKATLLRKLSAQIEEKDTSLTQYLTAMKIEDLLDPKEDKLPGEKLPMFCFRYLSFLRMYENIFISEAGGLCKALCPSPYVTKMFWFKIWWYFLLLFEKKKSDPWISDPQKRGGTIRENTVFYKRKWCQSDQKVHMSKFSICWKLAIEFSRQLYIASFWAL